METTIDYQTVASLNVNLNRQNYGPLDVSQVLKSQADLDYYRSGGLLSADAKTYPQTPYPYAGQVISLVDNSTGEVTVYKLVPNLSGYFDAVQIDAAINVDDLPLSAGTGVEITPAGYINTKLGDGLSVDNNNTIMVNILKLDGGSSTANGSAEDTNA